MKCQSVNICLCLSWISWFAFFILINLIFEYVKHLHAKEIKVYKTYSRFFLPVTLYIPFLHRKSFSCTFCQKKKKYVFSYIWMYMCVYSFLLISYFWFKMWYTATISICHSFTVCFFNWITHLGYTHSVHCHLSFFSYTLLFYYSLLRSVSYGWCLDGFCYFALANNDTMNNLLHM